MYLTLPLSRNADQRRLNVTLVFTDGSGRVEPHSVMVKQGASTKAFLGRLREQAGVPHHLSMGLIEVRSVALLSWHPPHTEMFAKAPTTDLCQRLIHSLACATYGPATLPRDS